MIAGTMVLSGRMVRLEALDRKHIPGLAVASAADREFYRWSPVPDGIEQVTTYVETALSWQDAGTAVPFAIVRVEDHAVIGSTRFWNIERWAWPRGHERQGRAFPDACEIGYTWFAKASIRTGANAEAKFLMLRHAFEDWGVLRVCFHTDERNERSRAALERLGAKFEGVLRAHRMAADFTARNSFRYSIVAAEWAGVKGRLRNQGVGSRQ